MSFKLFYGPYSTYSTIFDTKLLKFLLFTAKLQDKLQWEVQYWYLCRWMPI